MKSKEALAMKGVMTKKKTSSPCIPRPSNLEWVTRRFFLYKNGKMMYSRDVISLKPEEDDMILLYSNIANCVVDRAPSSDMGVKKSQAANSFYITGSDDNHASNLEKRALLVTNGPEDFNRWIMAFRRLNATVNVEVEGKSAVAEKRLSLTVDSELDEDQSPIPTEVSSKNSMEVSALFMSDAKFGDSAIFDVEGFVGRDD